MKAKFVSQLMSLALLVNILALAYPPVAMAVPGPVFVYPQNGQTLDYTQAYLFQVAPMTSAQGYLWGFFQDGVMVWENLRDEGQLSTNEYGIWPGGTAHSKFSVGDVQVMVRAMINYEWTDATTITIHLQLRVPVLQLAYYPPDPGNSAYLDPIETGWVGIKITDMQTATQGMVSAGIELINDATRYHGYKSPAALKFLEYFVFDKKEFFYPMPRGHYLGGTSYRPNYGQIMRDLDICDYVDNHRVKEVWIYGYHAGVIVPDESKMSSKYGDISNADPKDEFISETYRLPRCINSYVLYNFTYQPGGAQAIGNTIHNRLHQIENVIFFAEDRGYPVSYYNVVGSLFWDDFSVYGNRGQLPGYRASCGNTHSPPNTTEGYDYDSIEYRDNNCETWHPDDSLTTYVNANCTQWGCTDTGFYKWFMQNMPGYKNGIAYDGKRMRNWWEAMYDFNQFIDAGRSLFVIDKIQDVSITGPITGTIGTAYSFTATISPITATQPITYAWMPAPLSGQGSTVVTYTWAVTGNHVITVTATNKGGTVTDTHTIAISAPPSPWGVDLGVPSAIVIYRVPITNSGTTTDTYRVFVGGNSWPVEAPPMIGPLAANMTASLPVTVSVPATLGSLRISDTVTVTVVSQSDMTKSARISFTTLWNGWWMEAGYRIYLPLVLKD